MELDASPKVLQDQVILKYWPLHMPNTVLVPDPEGKRTHPHIAEEPAGGAEAVDHLLSLHDLHQYKPKWLLSLHDQHQHKRKKAITGACSSTGSTTRGHSLLSIIDDIFLLLRTLLSSAVAPSLLFL